MECKEKLFAFFQSPFSFLNAIENEGTEKKLLP